MKVTARSGSNIALIKYWGTDEKGRPLNPSLSMTLKDLFTTTTLEDGHPKDSFKLLPKDVSASGKKRVLDFLAFLKKKTEFEGGVKVVSKNNFPTGAGVASSASGFSALTMGFASLSGKEWTIGEMAALSARQSGSSARSYLGGYVTWKGGEMVEHVQAAENVDLEDLVLVVSSGEKEVSSAKGHTIAATSPLNKGRIDLVSGSHFEKALISLRKGDLDSLARITEVDAVHMHAVMMTSDPGLFYWNEGTLKAIKMVQAMRRQGVFCFFTIDAGPNVHVLTTEENVPLLVEKFQELKEVKEILRSSAGEGTHLTGEHIF